MASRKSTLGTTLVALQRAEAQVELLRKRAAGERAGHLKGLHLNFGFASRKELVDALLSLDGSSRRGAALGSSGDSAAAGGKKGKRARITADMRAEIVKAIKAGETGLTIAKRFGISGQSVQNVKKAAGLVQARKKKSK